MPPDLRVSTPPPADHLTREECLDLLAGCQVGRMVFTVDALPAVVPVAIAVDEGSVVCRTSSGSRLARAADGQVLALQVDDIDVHTRSGWSVVATGVAAVVRDGPVARRIAELVQPWVPGHVDVAVRLPLTVVTGRRLPAGGPR